MIRNVSKEVARLLSADQNSALSYGPKFLQKVINTLPQRVFWKDLNSVFIGCNDSFAQDADLDSPNDIVGLTDFDLPWLASESKSFIECDQRVIKNVRPEMGIIETCTRNGKTSWLETNKVPLMDEGGQCIGLLGAFHDITKVKEAEMALLRSNKVLQHRAKHDSLTDLFNRDYMLSMLEDVIAKRETFALLFIDIDRFKMINDSMGHSAADELLVLVSDRLSRSVRGADIVARFGGDEFTVLLPNIQSAHEVLTVCERIQRTLCELRTNHSSLTVTASIGAVIDLSWRYTDAEDALRDADTAMYEAKRNGKNCCRVFNDLMQTRVKEKLALENEMRNGLKNGEFQLNYQPIHHLENGRLKGFEALIRWQHPVRGTVPPIEFIELAEETGLIIELGEQVVRQSCQQLAKWRKEYPEITTDLTVSVNLSPVQLNGNRFLDVLDMAVMENGLQPGDLNIEITEGMLLDDNDAVNSLLNSFREKGYQLLLDDFGTGYCSLSYLHRFPMNTLKIDRSFIQAVEADHSSQAIVKTILGLAEILNLNVVAEGVETEAQEDFLKKMKCDLVQGYLYSKPLPAKQAAEYLASQALTAHKKSVPEN